MITWKMLKNIILKLLYILKIMVWRDEPPNFANHGKPLKTTFKTHKTTLNHTEPHGLLA